jgi:hypothetical protein
MVKARVVNCTCEGLRARGTRLENNDAEHEAERGTGQGASVTLIRNCGPRGMGQSVAKDAEGLERSEKVRWRASLMRPFLYS